jgi:hypothetical protein
VQAVSTECKRHAIAQGLASSAARSSQAFFASLDDRRPALMIDPARRPR